LPAGAIARLGTERFRQNGIGEMLFSDEGTALVAASDGEVRLWEVRTGRERRRLGLNLTGRYKTVVSAHGQIAAVIAGMPIRFWNLSTGQETRPLAEPDYVAADAAFSPDGTLLATLDGDAKGATVWDLTRERKAARIPLALIFGDTFVAFSPDGGLLAFPSRHELVVWDVKAGKELRRFAVGPAPPLRAAFSPDGKRLAAVDPFPPRGGAGRVHVWDVPTGECVSRWKEKDQNLPYSLAFSPDGKTLACGCRNGAISLREPDTGKELRRCDGRAFGIQAVAFSPDGRRLASASGHGVIRLWDPASGKELRPYDSPVHGLDWLAFTPDGRSVISVGPGQVAFWEPLTGRSLRPPEDVPTRFGSPPALSPDGKTVALIDGTTSGVCLRDLTTGEGRLVGGEPYRSYQSVFAPDGKTLATLSYRVATLGRKAEYSLCLLDADGGRLRRSIAAPAGLSSAAFWPGGEAVAVLTRDVRPPSSTLHKWRTADGAKEWQTPVTGFFMELAVAPDGRTLAVAGSKMDPESTGLVELRGAAGGEFLRRFDGHEATVLSVAFSPDGRTLATASRDNTVRLWEVATGEERHRLRGQPGGAGFGRVCFSPDGRLLATAGGDTGLVWDLTGRVRAGRFEPRPLPVRDLDRLGNDLAGADAAAAYRAVVALAGSPDNAVPFLRDRLLALTRPVEAKAVAELAALLDSPEFARRRDAALRLERLGLAAEAPLRRALAAAPSLEARRGVERVLERMTQSALVQADRAAEALEMAGTGPAVRALEEVETRARGSALRESVTAALQRLAQRHAPAGR
jgi:WD40 repeat protein